MTKKQKNNLSTLYDRIQIEYIEENIGKKVLLLKDYVSKKLETEPMFKMDKVQIYEFMHIYGFKFYEAEVFKIPLGLLGFNHDIFLNIDKGIQGFNSLIISSIINEFEKCQGKLFNFSYFNSNSTDYFTFSTTNWIYPLGNIVENS